MNAFSRSWEITKLSFGVINKDRELILFPILAGIFSLIFIIAMAAPSIIALIAGGSNANVWGALQYVLLFLLYLGLAFIATFFNMCVVYTAKKRFAGGNATFGETLSYAFSKIHLIFLWSMLAATVGLLLRLLDRMAEKAGGIGEIVLRILTSFLGLAWAIVTIFVVPGMLYHDLSPIDAIKKSVQTLKKTWGESLIRYYGLGMVQFVFFIIGVIVAVPLVLVSLSLGPIALVAVIAVAVIYLLGVFLVFGIANTIFNTALYEYADTGKIPAGYSHDIMAGAFKPKKKSFLGRGIV